MTKKNNVLPIQSCIWCSSQFVPVKKDQKFCSRKCGANWWNRELAPKRKEKYDQNTEEIRRKGKESYQKHRQKRLEYARSAETRARQNRLNKTSVRRAYHREHIKKLRRKNPISRLRLTIRERLRVYPYKGLPRISRKLEENLGYQLELLWNQLQKTLPAECTETDYLEGRLVIDHIIPICRYCVLMVGDSEFQKCWNPKNLRLVSKQNNQSKNSRFYMELVQQYDLKNLLPEDPQESYKKWELQQPST